MNNPDSRNYNDIIHLPHHVSKKHPQMSLLNRAAQFSLFASLAGYDAAIREASHLTEPFAELDEDKKERLNAQLHLIQKNITQNPKIEFSYFQPDSKKDGGTYTTVSGRVKKIDEYHRRIIFMDGSSLLIEQIRSINGELFGNMEE